MEPRVSMGERPELFVNFSDAHAEELGILRGVQSYVADHDLDWKVISSVGLQWEWRWQQLRDLGKAAVFLGRHPRIPVFDELRSKGLRWISWLPEAAACDADSWVSWDAGAIGRIAAEHLHAAGARTFAYQGPIKTKTPQRQARHDAFRQALEARGLPCHVMWKEYAPPAEHERQLLSFCQTQAQPIGFFFYHDIQADRFLHILQRVGITVPQEAMLVGGSASAKSAALNRPITSVRLPFVGLGRALAAQAHLLLSGTVPDPVTIAPVSVISRATTTLPPSTVDPLIKRIQDWLDNDRKPIPSVNDIAAHTKLHRNSLARRFQDAFGQAPKQWLKERAMERAGRLLAESDQAIDDIATTCGFVHASNFSQTFRQRFGMAPSAYRQQFRG